MTHRPASQDMNCPFLKVGTIVPSNGVSFSMGPLQSLTLTATTASTSTSTGSLVAAGGAGIAGDLYTSSVHAVATTASTSVTTGSLVAAGGAGIAGAAYIGSIVSTTPGTAAGQVLRYEDVFTAVATAISGFWSWDNSSGATNASETEATVVNFARTGNLVSIYQSAANTGISATAAASTDPTFYFTGTIPASFRTATTRQAVIAGHYSGVPAAFAMQASGTALTMQYVGTVDTTAPGTVAAGAFVFNYVI